MRLLMLSAYYEPEVAASLYLATNLNEDLAKKDVFVDVYTPMPSRGVDEATRMKYRSIPLERFFGDKLKIHRFAMPKEGKNALARALRYFYLNLVLFFKGLFVKTDAIFLYSTPPTNGLMGAVLKFFKRVPFIYDLQDVFPDSMVNAGMVQKGSFLWKIGRWMENITYRSADKIIVISEDFRKNLLAKGVPEQKIEIVYNWVDEQAVRAIDREQNTLFDQYGLDRDKFYVTYCGNIGFSQNMDLLLQVAKELMTKKEIRFVIIGDGAYRQELEEQIVQERVSNIMLLPFQPYDMISHVFSLGDVGLVISKAGIGENSVPSKTWSILSAERAVLASFDQGSELSRIVEKANCGICVEADAKEKLKDAILWLFHNQQETKRLGKNGRDYILKNLTRKIGTDKIFDIVHSVLKK